MDSTEQESMDAAANLAAMQRTARQRLADGTFSLAPTDECAQPAQEGAGIA